MIKIPVEVGDTILTGRFKNKSVIVKTIETDEHGMPTINGKKVVTFRIKKEEKNEMKKSELKEIIKKIIREEILKENLLNEGATSIFMEIPGNEIKVKKLWNKIYREAIGRYHDENASYSGDWNTLSGLKITQMEFLATKNGKREARDWILNNAKKWKEALAVKIGKNKWLIGGWASE